MPNLNQSLFGSDSIWGAIKANNKNIADMIIAQRRISSELVKGNNATNKKTIAIAVSIVSLLAVPTLMASENWDDHDRSNRYTTRLNAQAYLESCDENAIMFTIGDNDTFPLWYMQEVEGIRTDLKLVNTSLFATDWYIDQMKRATYDAPPIPSQLKHDQYRYCLLYTSPSPRDS